MLRDQVTLFALVLAAYQPVVRAAQVKVTVITLLLLLTMTDAFRAHLRLGQLAALRARQLLHQLFHYVVCSLKLLILFCLHGI